MTSLRFVAVLGAALFLPVSAFAASLTLAPVNASLKVGETFIVHKGTIHRLVSKKGGVVVEVAIGSSFNEDDIVRLEDDHGRVSK